MVSRRLGSLPWPVRLVLGSLCAAAGVVLTLRPFTSLSVLVVLVAVGSFATGLVELARAGSTPSPLLRRLVGAGWVGVAAVTVLWPDLTVRGIAVFVGVAMVVSGVADLVASIRGSTDERLASFLGGLASVVLGVLALSWPDVTLLVVAVVFGARTVLFGLGQAVAAVRERGDGEAGREVRPRGRVRRWLRVAGTAVALALALVLAGLSSALHEAQAPAPDDFYAAPDDVPAEPGVLLRSEPFTNGIPPAARAWRILYTTTRDEGRPAVASGIVVVPSGASVPAPVVAWAHGTTGVDPACAPSLMQTGLEAGALLTLDTVVDQRWALVATDYVGLGTEGPHPYLIGQGQARSVLDAVRAARQLDEADLSGETVVWGHSQGGNAALWTGAVAPSYAPDVPLSGVAALAPASDLLGLMENLPNVPGGSIFATYVLAAYVAHYPDVQPERYVRPAASTAFAETAERCLDGAALASALSAVTIGFDGFADLESGPLVPRLAENVPWGPIEAPLLIGQGGADQLVLPAVQDRFVADLCARGQQVDYRTYAGRDHVPVVEPDSPLIPELIGWTADRLAGAPASSTCPDG